MHGSHKNIIIIIVMNIYGHEFCLYWSGHLEDFFWTKCWEGRAVILFYVWTFLCPDEFQKFLRSRNRPFVQKFNPAEMQVWDSSNPDPSLKQIQRFLLKIFIDKIVKKNLNYLCAKLIQIYWGNLIRIIGGFDQTRILQQNRYRIRNNQRTGCGTSTLV